MKNKIKLFFGKILPGKWVEDSDGDGRHCPNCNTDYCYLAHIPEDYKYCPACGKKMHSVKNCKYGGEISLAEEYRYCPECGKRLYSASRKRR